MRYKIYLPEQYNEIWEEIRRQGRRVDLIIVVRDQTVSDKLKLIIESSKLTRFPSFTASQNSNETSGRGT
ncbi:MAG: hypothetical protein QXK66_04145 [Sulfolobales archaeon]